MTGFTDIRAQGWVARLPASWRPYALLARFDRPIGAWLLVLPGYWAIAAAAPTGADGIRLMLLFTLGAFAMRGAGCVVNDLWDRELDRQVERTRGRPLASGAVTPWQAVAFLAALCAIGAAVLFSLPTMAIAVGLFSLVPIALYPLAKRITDWPQAVLGFVFSWAAPTGWAAATGTLDAAAFALWAAGFFWILGYDTVYAHQDREDDALVGIRSTARKFGADSAVFVAGCYAATVALLGVAGLLAGASLWFFLALLLPAWMLSRQAQALDIHDPALCLRLFKSNREAGLAIALAFLIGRL
ncbi:4-hydroxybenzoate octaprenyltransferase [Falsiroseomonas bella]|uniref:4-hydroxybenzoate octaprenyltransferase n=1 Tax=Falsiroseomonas bella TaxID=2184016 RepID=A0A317FK13_9PROT|nr:4-hydroxybenzoate octaprenyltransferase [Falsiroseomonas bella]PWS38682.1 4-hydroxybenzoate octaprenyltransferase [Falsiroseomonas bella]